MDDSPATPNAEQPTAPAPAEWAASPADEPERAWGGPSPADEPVFSTDDGEAATTERGETAFSDVAAVVSDPPPVAAAAAAESRLAPSDDPWSASLPVVRADEDGMRTSSELRVNGSSGSPDENVGTAQGFSSVGGVAPETGIPQGGRRRRRRGGKRGGRSRHGGARVENGAGSAGASVDGRDPDAIGANRQDAADPSGAAGSTEAGSRRRSGASRRRRSRMRHEPPTTAPDDPPAET